MIQMKKPANVIHCALAHLISLVAFGLIMAEPGARVPFLVLIAAVCVLCTLVRARPIQIWAVFATLLTLCVITWENWQGMKEQRRLSRAWVELIGERSRRGTEDH
jgi:hypothetical protein